MTMVYDIINLMEEIAPGGLAEDWDNSGLQCGDRNWPVNHILVALDPSPEVIQAACQTNADLLITHHPLIFKPLKNLALDSPLGKLIHLSITHQVAVFSAHTNLDSVSGGLNDFFAEKIGLLKLTFLSGAPDLDLVKLVVHAPEDACETVLNGLIEAGAGSIGNYSSCTFRSLGIGTFQPGPDARPHIGAPGVLESVAECRIETRLQKHQIPGVLNHVRACHPYETMACDVYPLHPVEINHGIGRVGELKRPMELKALSAHLKSIFHLSILKVSGPPDMQVNKIAVCTGSGSGLVKSFLASDADVFISGDLKYHDAQDARMNGRALIDVGHFASEEIMIALITDRLTALIRREGLDVSVEALHMESDPFYYL